MAFTHALASSQILRSEAVPVDPPIEEAFRYMAKTTSMLVALQLEDILADNNQANMPGPDLGHPNWRRKLTRTVDAILAPGGPLAIAADATLDEGRALSLNAPRLSWPPPAATYRLQLHKDFAFAQAIEALPYIRGLGFTHVYASPVLKARPGSTHRLRHGGPARDQSGARRAGRVRTIRRCHQEEPDGASARHRAHNHMGVGGSDNPWWLSLLEWGELSPFADTYDIDWERMGAYGKLVAPFLGGQYGEILEKGDLKLSFDKAEGSFSVWHYEHRFPICPLTYPRILDRAVAVDASEGGDGIDGLLRVAEELRALAEEPANRRQDNRRGLRAPQAAARRAGPARDGGPDDRPGHRRLQRHAGAAREFRDAA